MLIGDANDLEEVLRIIDQSGYCRVGNQTPVRWAVVSLDRESNLHQEREATMKVQDIMVEEAKSCRLDTNLAVATQIMWTDDCGALPVLDAQGKVVGMITDRDICMAVGTRNRAPSEITVAEVKPNPPEVYTCAPEDDIHAALRTMRTQGVRRLPVVNSGTLRGILCLDDIALNSKKVGDLSYKDVVETLQAICEHRIARQTVAA